MVVARFEAMGVEVVVGGATDAELVAVVDLVADWERTFGRSRPESELSRVNASTAEALVVSPRFAETVEVALLAARGTDGLVAPAPGCWRDIHVSGRVLVRPPGTCLDLNGVVKALVVDAALDLLAGDGFASAGGGLAVRGALSVELPAGGALLLERGGLATSSSGPAESPWTSVTVAAGSCLAADVAAKAAFLSGSYGPEWLDLRGLAGRFVADEQIVENRAWRTAVSTGALAA